MVKTPKLFFMDSGLGGLAYMDCVRRLRPLWSYTYLADSAFFPYGLKSSLFLQERLCRITEHVQNHLKKPDLMVVACNTASVSALTHLRQKFDFPIVGVVPAVKSASACKGDIGILATEQTVKGEYLDALIHQFVPHKKVERLAAPDLVDFVENRLFFAREKEIRQVLEPYVEKIRTSRWKAVILGCTHFILLKTWFKTLLPPDVRIIDSTEGVTRRVLSLLPGDGKMLPKQEGKDCFYTSPSSRDDRSCRLAAEQRNMDYGIQESL